MHTGICIRGQHSVDELCKAAARRLSDFCCGLESSSSTETLRSDGSSPPNLSVVGFKHHGNEDTVDVYSQWGSVQNIPVCNLALENSEFNYNLTGPHEDEDCRVAPDDKFPQPSLENTSWREASTSSEEAYLIPLPERQDVDTSLLYPPPPPPSPGDSTQTGVQKRESLTVAKSSDTEPSDHNEGMNISFNGCSQNVHFETFAYLSPPLHILNLNYQSH